MQIKRVELEGILKLVKLATSPHMFVEEFTCFIFDKDIIYGTDGDFIISRPFDCNFTCLVSANRLSEVLSKITLDDLNIIYKNDKLLIKTKSASVRLKTLPLSESIIDVIKGRQPTEWSPLPTNFVEGIRSCLFSVSKDLARVDMSSISINGNKVNSSDDIRGSIYKMNAELPPFLLPLRAGGILVELSKAVTLTKYCLADHGVFFTDGVYTFYTIKTDSKYSDIEPHFDFQGVEFDLPDNFCSSIELVSIFSDEKFNFDKLITMRFQKDRIKLSSEDSFGSIDKAFPCNLEGLEKEFSVMVNPTFLIEVLAKIQADTKRLKVGVDRILFDFGHFKHLMVAFGEEG